MEYKIEVSMTPYYHDSPNAPYFYCILGRREGEKWHNCGHGWGRTQEEAWKMAYSDYEDLMLYNAQKRRASKCQQIP
jgi:hypothetical protein